MYNISKYVDFYVVEKTSKKSSQPYYAIVLKLFDNDYVLQFLTKDRFDSIVSSISK